MSRARVEGPTLPRVSGAPGEPRIGCDVADIDEVREAVRRFGERYLRRVYDLAELAESGCAPERLAARFAAKEAVVKLLRPSADDPIGYRDVVVRHDRRGAPTIRLAPRAAALAAREGLGPIAVSLSHGRELAFATAVAIRAEGPTQPRRKEAAMSESAAGPAGDREVVRAALAEYGRLGRPIEELADGADLFAAGFTSHATVNVMLAIEDELGIEFPDALLTRSTFQSVAALTAAVASARLDG